MADWTEREFTTLLEAAEISDEDLTDQLSGKSRGAVGVVRAGVHDYHTGRDHQILSRMMLGLLKRRPGRTTCSVCQAVF